MSEGQQEMLADELRLAFVEGDIARVRELVGSGQVSANCVYDTGWTPLHFASTILDILIAVEIAGFLVEHGADVNAQDDEGKTPLHWAVQIPGRHGFAEFLLDNGADIESRSRRDGCTPLGVAVKAGNSDTVSLLLDRGARTEEVEVSQTESLCALHHACRVKNIEIVTLLVDHDGVDVNRASRVSGTDDTDLFMMTPLDVACTMDSLQIAEILHQNGASVFPNGLSHFSTPFASAIRYGSLRMVQLLLDSIAPRDDHVERRGVALPANVEVANILGGQLLSIALDLKHLGVAQLLVDYGANVNYGPRLVQCAELGYLEGARFLLGAGADKNRAYQSDGETPMWVAANEGHVELVQEFLKAEADLNIRNNRGETPLGVAYRKGHTAVVYVLLRASPDLWPRLKDAF